MLIDLLTRQWLTLHGLVAITGLVIYVIASRMRRQRRHPSAAIAWVVSLALMPYLALPLYLLFGSRKVLRNESTRPALPCSGRPPNTPAARFQHLATAMGLPSLSPGLLGVTMLLDGIPDFSHIPPGSRLQAASGATIVVNLNNRPCTVPLKAIEAAHPGYGAKFKPAANGLRGIVGWVEREGPLHLGDTVRLHIPDQRPWAHL